MKKCIFVGPSLAMAGEQYTSDIDVFEPAALGSIYRAVTQGYEVIGLIDGFFGNVPSVWHKEILYALSQGCEVFGAASIGALRASELSVYGMKGVGLAYRLFKQGVLTDDDEVCVLHGPKEINFRPVTEAMINVRITLRKLRRKGLISLKNEQTICREVKNLHFSERTEKNIFYILKQETALPQKPNGLKNNRLQKDDIVSNYLNHQENIKQKDALILLNKVKQCVKLSDKQHIQHWEFPATVHWKNQFDLELSDIPELV